MLRSNKSALLYTLLKTRYLAYRQPYKTAPITPSMQVSFAMQANDLLTAAAPISIKKQDLLDLESGVSSVLVMHAEMFASKSHNLMHSLSDQPVSAWPGSDIAFDILIACGLYKC